MKNSIMITDNNNIVEFIYIKMWFISYIFMCELGIGHDRFWFLSVLFFELLCDTTEFREEQKHWHDPSSI